MKQRIYLILVIVFALLFPLVNFAQHEDLKEQLKGKETLAEMVATVEAYLSTAPDSREKQRLEKHFARWAYFQSLHLGPDGEFVNVAQRNFDAIQDKVIPPPGESINGDWSFVGPSSTTTNNPDANFLGLGRADRLAFHPTNTNIIYVGTPSGGLWKTTDRGSNWTPISDYIPSIGVSGVVVDHSNPNRLYVLTGDGDTYDEDYLVYKSGYNRLSVGVLVSHDAGVTWEQTGELFNGEYVGYRLVQHPSNANILLAATSEGVYRTVDGGGSWVMEHPGKHYDIEFKPGTPSRVYASGVGSFIYSTDTGDTWDTTATFSVSLCEGGRVELAVTPDYSNKVYLLAGPKTAGNTFCGFYVSTDGGLNFTRMCTAPNILGTETGAYDQSAYDMGLAVSPTDDQIVIAAGLVTFKSTNGGATFNNATTYNESGGNYIHPDIHGLEYNPLNGYLYAVGDGGIHESTNDGDTYTNIYTGLNTTQFYGMADYDANQYVLIGGCQDNGLKYKKSNTSSFDHIYCCDAADAVINYNDSSKGYAAVNAIVLKYDNFISLSPTVVYNAPGFFCEVEMNTSNTDLVYIGYSRVRQYNATTGISTYLGGTEINGWWALKTCPSNSNRIYAAGGDHFADTAGGVFVSSDGGSNWTTISGNTGFPASYNRISDIGVWPSASNVVFVTFSGYTDNQKVYLSPDAGANWINISYDLPNIPVWTIEVDANRNAYIGTEYGVFYWEYNSFNWEPFYNSLPNVPVSELAINESANVLYAATFGRGIWKSTLWDPCPPNLYLTADIEGLYFRSASVSIRTISEVIGGTGTNVALRAGDYVDMEPGFLIDASTGNKFLAYIGACNSGLPPDMGYTNPVIPDVLKDHKLSLTRRSGTIEITKPGVTPKKMTLRLFSNGEVRVVLAAFNGTYIKDITSFSAKEGTYNYDLETAGLKSGMYYLYLVVDDEVVHLQELDVPLGNSGTGKSSIP